MKQFLLSAAIMVVGVFVLGTRARADESHLVANIDHNFIASGETHSAGKYKVYQLSPETLVLQSDDTRSSFFLPVVMRDDASLDQQLGLKLILSDGVYYLRQVATSGGIYTLSVPRGLTPSPKSNGHDGTAGSGSK